MVLATHQHCHVEFQGPVRLGRGFELDIPDRGTLIVGPGVDFRRGFICEISNDGRVIIGGGCTFTAQALIQCSTSIEIGTRCSFGQSTLIADGIHRFRDHTRHWSEQGNEHREIRIGKDVMVNTKVTILNSIGDSAVIGANAVVSKPIPAFCVAVGVPARVVEYFGPPELRPEGLDL